VALVILTAALSCGAEWLAGITGKDGVNRASEGAAVKGGAVVPYGSGGKVSGALCGDDGLPRVGFPFDKASGVEAGLGQHEAHIKSTGASAEGESVSGTCCHVIVSLRLLSVAAP